VAEPVRFRAVPQQKRQRQKAGKQFRQEQIRAAQRRRKRRNQAIAIAVVVAIIGLAAFALSRGGDETDVATDGTTSTTANTPAVEAKCPPADGSAERALQFKDAPPMCIDPAKKYEAHVSTTEGNYVIALDTAKTPNTVNNFVFLSRYHYYDGDTITRIDNSIEILQTGSPHTGTIADPGPGYNIKDEGTGFQYSEGDVVMARSQGPDSGSAQYFLIYGPKAAALNQQGTYVTFGKVSGDGLGVLKKIGALFEPCPPGDQTCLGGRPSRKVTINKIEIKEL
jgi:cyclophilin family peptidyl-prolyl cis-trans isomerase